MAVGVDLGAGIDPANSEFLHGSARGDRGEADLPRSEVRCHRQPVRCGGVPHIDVIEAITNGDQLDRFERIPVFGFTFCEMVLASGSGVDRSFAEGQGPKEKVSMTTRVGLYHYPRKRLPWVVRWFGESDLSAGGQRRYSKSFRLGRDAERFQASKQAEFDKGAQRDRPADLTLAVFCKKYLTRRQHEWAEKTRLQIDDLCNRLCPDLYFGRTFR